MFRPDFENSDRSGSTRHAKPSAEPAPNSHEVKVRNENIIYALQIFPCVVDLANTLSLRGSSLGKGPEIRSQQQPACWGLMGGGVRCMQQRSNESLGCSVAMLSNQWPPDGLTVCIENTQHQGGNKERERRPGGKRRAEERDRIRIMEEVKRMREDT
ncbi:unnamed protein product [Pleuronectes platessa]|uniref:Uncharacterized protein n=1 Tax=Pleuronectes platessa TaxID=8262 RepID=A0A9N7TSY8_PLEPL|nr:unnamed protein product [Pleuronectes platessa]